MIRQKCYPFVFSIFIFTTLWAGCAKKCLINEQSNPELYHIARPLPANPLTEDPTFIVYGDTQAAWRVEHRFAKIENWLTWKMLIFPFYEVYWLGNGVIGALNWFRRAPDYGFRSRQLMREVVYSEFQASELDFILNTGDISAHDGRRPGHWEIIIRENKYEHPLLDEVPYLPTMGNHDRVNDPVYGRPNFEAIFGYPPFYKIESPNMALFVLNSNLIIDWQDEIEDERQNELFETWFASDDPDHPAWLERELAASNKPFKIVSMHHSPLSFGHHWREWIKSAYGHETVKKRKQVLDLFKRTGVQVVFSGHDHIYQHNVWRSSTGGATADIHFIVSSGGGAPLRSPISETEKEVIQKQYLSEGFEVVPLVQEKAYHYCLVHVDDFQLTISTFSASHLPEEDHRLIGRIVIPAPGDNAQFQADTAKVEILN